MRAASRTGSERNVWLVVGGGLSAAASAIHLGALVGGPAWYRFFGAGEETARAAERGSPVPGLMAVGIAAVLAAWAAYAWAGAGLIPRLPLMRAALVAITAVYLARGLLLVPSLVVNPGGITPFWLWSSLIVLAYGAVHALGTWRAWPALSRRA